MSKFKTRFSRQIATIVIGLSLSGVGFAADDYYRWVGKDGVVHYGSRPPEGVQAEKIQTYGKSKPVSEPTSGLGGKQGSAAGNANLTEQQRQIVAQRQQQCQEEKERLTSLQAPGRRIRMQQPDGSSRYLSPEEIAKEISSSQDFISQACK